MATCRVTKGNMTNLGMGRSCVTIAHSSTGQWRIQPVLLGGRIQ